MKHFKAFCTSAAVIACIALMSNGCKKEDNPATTPPPSVEHPPATTVTLLLSDSTGTMFVDSCTVRDTSLVHHGESPVIGQLDLRSGTKYRGTFALYDETQSPVANITSDIVSEKDAHLFTFLFSPDSARVVVDSLDKDANGLPFGLTFSVHVSPGAALSGNLHVILQHHDDGIKFNTNGTYHEPYDLDLDRDFPVSIVP